MTELSEAQIQNKVVCTRCNTDYSDNILEKMCMGKTSICQMCRAELSGKYAGLPPKPFFKATLPMPPSVNHYWSKSVGRAKGKSYVHVRLSDRATKFRNDVVAQVADIAQRHGSIRTHNGRIKAVVTLHGATKRSFDVDNFMKGIGDALTHSRVYKDDQQIDELIVRRGEVIKGGRVDVELYELKGNQKGINE